MLYMPKNSPSLKSVLFCPRWLIPSNAIDLERCGRGQNKTLLLLRKDDEMQALSVLEYNNKRVMTTEVLADHYGTDSSVISRNYQRNSDRYMPGKHFYFLDGERLREFITTRQIDVRSRTAKLYLWTERGALLHAKSLNTDEAWDVYEKLVETYFRVKDMKDKFKQSDFIHKDDARIKALDMKKYNALKAEQKSITNPRHRQALQAKAIEILMGYPLIDEYDEPEATPEDSINMILELINNNQDKFNGLWGWHDENGTCLFERHIIENEMNDNGYDLKSHLKDWHKSGHISRNGHGKFSNQRRKNGVLTSYIKFIIK